VGNWRQAADDRERKDETGRGTIKTTDIFTLYWKTGIQTAVKFLVDDMRFG
jgi:hypothetical protein